MPKTILITGASDGIGAANARYLAGPDINLLLTARDEHTLEKVAHDCRMSGSAVIIFPGDVASADDMASLRAMAVKSFQRIDVWINIAGIAQVGRFIDIPPADFERVIAVNLLGVVNGSREALKQFELQKNGTLINVSSVLGIIADPYESAYVSSKFAVRGFTSSIRHEYQLSHPDIHICCVLPSSIATNIYAKASNYSTRGIRLIPPVYSPLLVAKHIRQLLECPRSEVIVGGGGKLLAATLRLSPSLADVIFRQYVKALHFKNKATAITQGNLYRSVKTGRTHTRALPNWFDSSIVVLALLCIFKIYVAKRRNYD